MTHYDIAVVTNVPAPYKTSRLNSISQQDNVSLQVFYSNEETSRHSYEFGEVPEFEHKIYNSNLLEFSNCEIQIETESFISFANINPDIFIVKGWNYSTAWSAIVWSCINRIPLIIQSANINQGEFTKRILPYIFRSADHFLALSSMAKQNLINLGISASSITIVPNSIAVETFLQKVDPKKIEEIKKNLELRYQPTVLYVGKLTKNKGIIPLVKAVKRIEMDINLLIIGTGPLYEKLKQDLIKPDDGIKLLGHIHNNKLPNYYSMSDVFVLPTSKDRWGIVLNEALACGTPVITTEDAGAAGELVKDRVNGIIIEDNGVDDLIVSIRRILRNDRLYQKLSRSAKSSALEYDSDKYAEKVLKVIEEQIN